MSMKLPVLEKGKGDDVLLIHGIISDKSFFEELMEQMEQDFHLIAYDRRGYGDAEKAEDYSIWAQAEDAAGILKDYAKDKAWIVGNSAGGMVAMALYLRYPRLVRGMLLIEPSLVFDPASEEMIREWNRELNGYVEEKRIKKALPAVARVIGDKTEVTRQQSFAELKRAYKNLETFMLGELNDIQRFRPAKEEFEAAPVPIRVLISEEGKESIFAKTSLLGAQVLGWPVEYLCGYHNTLSRNPEDGAKRLKAIIEEMENGSGT